MRRLLSGSRHLNCGTHRLRIVVFTANPAFEDTAWCRLGENFCPADRFELQRIDLGGDHNTLGWKARVHGFDLRRWRERWHWVLRRRSPPDAA